MHKHPFITAVVLALALLIGNCSKKSNPSSPPSGPFNLVMSFSGMTPHIGQLLEINVIDTMSNAAVADTVLMKVPSDAFTLDFGSKLISGHTYDIDFWADLNKNGIYDAPPVDHAWRIMLSDVDKDTDVTFMHNTNFTDIHLVSAAMHTVTMSFTDMTPHIGQLLQISLIDTIYGTTVVDTDIQQIPSSNFTVNLGKKAVAGRPYRIDFWADLNKNGEYDAPPVDHAWRIMLPMISGDTTVTFAHNTNFTDIHYPQDSMYKVTMSFTDMTPHIGQLLQISLIDTIYGTTVVDTDIQQIPSSNFTVNLGKKAVAGRPYRIDFWADLNKNGEYDAPPVDHAWRIMLPMISGDTTVTFTHNTNFTDIHYPQDSMRTVTMSFTGMTPHMGQKMQFLVIDSIYNTSVKDTVLTAVPSDTFTMALGGVLVNGRSYRIDFYADLNGSGSYDPPPVDHAWRIQLPMVSADTTVSFAHNTNFTNIAGDPGLQ